MIKYDVLVFDCVAHPFDFDASNVLGNAGELFRQHLYAFHNILTHFEIPEDLVEGYGYPQLTETAKRKILGENLLRLSGMDVEETRSKLAGAT